MEPDLQEATARIVAAYVGHHEMPPEDLPVLISQVSVTLRRLSSPVEEEPQSQEPAVPIKKSVTRDHLVCLECGQKVKMLRRHLQTTHGMGSGEYREKWGLARDYPLVAPSYTKKRSELAVSVGLGRRKRGEVIPLNGTNAK